ncbi:hypothetical protein KAU11_10850 [Candidatus Babeliales bacterium]|nr:hypothetical protein [Candidatus Babeliales bacterium]MCK4636010.1 hypothetical protein [Candidatus Moranbacteria bacterium]
MEKKQKNSPLLWASIALLLIISIAVIANYIGIAEKWSEKDLNGLKLTTENSGEYFGEEYICNRKQSLFIQISGSENNVRDRTAKMTMLDDFSGEAISENMRVKTVTDDAVTYVYKENSLIIYKDGRATFSIYNKMLEQPRDVPVLENCKKVEDSK